MTTLKLGKFNFSFFISASTSIILTIISCILYSAEWMVYILMKQQNLSWIIQPTPVMQLTLMMQRGLDHWSSHFWSTELQATSHAESRHSLNTKMGTFRELISLKRLETGIYHIKTMLDAKRRCWTSAVTWSISRRSKRDQIWSSIRYLLGQGKLTSRVMLNLSWH